MPARITTIAFEGAEARRVEAEVVLTNGHISFHVVGLGDKAVAESRERVRGAFAGMGLSLPCTPPYWLQAQVFMAIGLE